MKGNGYIYLNKLSFLPPNNKNYSLSEFMRKRDLNWKQKNTVSKWNKIAYKFIFEHQYFNTFII